MMNNSRVAMEKLEVRDNFDVPKCVHNYLHRIGRSGRWGRKGIGINLITRRDVTIMKDIEAHYSCQINELPADFDTLLK
jgi:superfamily II DNA/RNA helicase